MPSRFNSGDCTPPPPPNSNLTDATSQAQKQENQSSTMATVGSRKETQKQIP
ncbi:hypothetical protein Pint_17500 [Pistacia integerrima]|uniref:Uncharacterized protein n=1 Tax=Pistacia integerrima TaxID=434235 RepID=A0ACC0YY96_9ROSI|nr:hypothetical protein Pint_17500 [Pistacia integerrima]